MRTFSRWMPPKPQRPPQPPTTFVGWLIIAWLVIALWPVFVALLVFFLVGSYFGSRHERRLAAELAVERAGEDIGTFARAFDRSNEPFDPWVIRATWEAMKPYRGDIPLRPTDRIEDDLGLSMHDLEIDYLLLEVATRSGHSVDGIKTLHKVETVGNFVKLIASQPLLPEHQRRSA